MRHTSLQEANTESLASGVGMRFRSFERRGNAFSKWFEGSEGFLGLPHARGGIAGTRIVASLTLCTPKTVYCLFIRCLLIICCLPSQTSQHARPCAHLALNLLLPHSCFELVFELVLELLALNLLELTTPIVCLSLFLSLCSTLCTPKTVVDWLLLVVCCLPLLSCSRSHAPASFDILPHLTPIVFLSLFLSLFLSPRTKRT